MDTMQNLVSVVIVTILALGFLAWLALRQLIRQNHAENLRQRRQMALWQSLADERAERLKRLNDECLARSRECLRQSAENLERTNAFIDAFRLPRDRG